MQEQEERSEVINPSALELIQRAEIDMQITTAKKYPRDLARVKKRMLEFATLDEETAESCFYTLPRDGKAIQGPSVRLAEIAVACYGNIRAASRIIENDGKAITSQGACHDLENNTLISVEVKRRITDKYGKTYKDDMQIVTGNAANSIAFRNAVFKVVPGALIKPVYEAAKAVAVGDATTLSTKRDKIVKRLNAMQVDTPRILEKLGKSSVENIGLEDLEILIGLGTAIKDGDTTVDEAFSVSNTDKIRATVSMDSVKASADANRGHDATNGSAKENVSAGSPAKEEAGASASTAAKATETPAPTMPKRKHPKNGVPVFEDFPAPQHMADGQKLWVNDTFYEFKEGQGFIKVEEAAK